MAWSKNTYFLAFMNEIQEEKEEALIERGKDGGRTENEQRERGKV